MELTDQVMTLSNNQRGLNDLLTEMQHELAELTVLMKDTRPAPAAAGDAAPDVRALEEDIAACRAAEAQLTERVAALLDSRDELQAELDKLSGTTRQNIQELGPLWQTSSRAPPPRRKRRESVQRTCVAASTSLCWASENSEPLLRRMRPSCRLRRPLC